MKRDGGDGMLPFAKRDISEWSSRYEPKIINREILIRFAGNPMSIKHPKVTVLLLLVQLGHTKHCSLYEYIYFRIFWRLLM